MSRANVDVVEQGIDAFNRRDIDGFAQLTTEDFVWLPALPGAVEGGTYRGRSGISRYFAESGSTWEELTVLCDELRDLDDSVVVLGRAMGRGLQSGVAVEMPLAFVAEFRRGKIACVRTFLDHGEGLRSAGLSE